MKICKTSETQLSIVYYGWTLEDGYIVTLLLFQFHLICIHDGVRITFSNTYSQMYSVDSNELKRGSSHSCSAQVIWLHSDHIYQATFFTAKNGHINYWFSIFKIHRQFVKINEKDTIEHKCPTSQLQQDNDTGPVSLFLKNFATLSPWNPTLVRQTEHK